MSSKEPTACYVYQPDPPPKNVADPKIYALGGPGSEHLRGNRYTKAEAQRIAEYVNAAERTEPCCNCGMPYPRQELLAGEILCRKCRSGDMR